MSGFKLVFATTVFLVLFGLSTYVSAANIRSDILGINFSGEIQAGDAERLVAELLQSAIKISKNNYLNHQRIQLDSFGGDVKEAVKIASLIKAAYLDVNVVGSVNGSCASSCFFIFLAGQKREASGTEYIAEWGPAKSLGAVGIHRPYYSSPEGGPASAKKQEDAMQETAFHLQSQRVPQYLIDEMMSHASNDIYWLKVRDLQALEKYSSGVEEELIAKCNYNSKKEANITTYKEYSKYFVASGIGACVITYLNATYGPLRNAVFEKMRKGWRPWKKS